MAGNQLSALGGDTTKQSKFICCIYCVSFVYLYFFLSSCMKVTGAVMHAAAGYKYGGNATDLLSALLFSVDTLLLSFVTV